VEFKRYPAFKIVENLNISSIVVLVAAMYNYICGQITPILKNTMDAHIRKIKTMKVVLVIGFLLMGLKFIAYYFTNSNAILTDAVESIVNVLAGSFALYSLYYAAKPKDADHPYGHGKIEFLSTGVEGGMVSLAGVAMIIKGITAFFNPQPLQNLDVGLTITVFSGAVNFAMARVLIKRGTALHSSTMVADGRHLLTDTWSSVGLLVGLTLIYFTKLYWIDYVITIGLGVFIIYIGIDLVKESVFNLLDTADYEKIDHLISVLNAQRKESWIDIHNLRVVKYGSVVHVDCHMTLPWYYTLEEAHREVDTLSKLATKNLDYETEFFIHADPCLPKSCSICEMHNCKVRQHVLVKRLEWDMQNVLPDAKHTIIS
jgi:cation diffusion facilitator family transporter